MFLEVKNVTKSIHGDVVIKNVSLCSERGRVIGLRGINGSGKTMLMRLISGLIRPTKGQVLIDGEVVSKVNKRIDGCGRWSICSQQGKENF